MVPSTEARRGAAGERIREVAVLDADAGHERRQVDLREDDVAFRLVVEEPDAAAKHQFGR